MFARKIHSRLFRPMLAVIRKLADRYYQARCQSRLTSLGYSRPVFLVRRLYNVIVLSDGDTYFKIGYATPNTVQLEYDNGKALADNYPLLEKYLPQTRLLFLGKWPCMCSSALQPIDNQQVKAYAAKIVTDFMSCAEYRTGSLEELLSIKAGIDVLARLAPDKPDLHSKARVVLGNQRFHFGPCHGDFHRANLLSKNGSTPVLIDMDCVRLCSIQELDILYFNIEEISAKELIGWPDILENHLDYPGRYHFDAFEPDVNVNVNDNGLIFLYILDRIGQEAKYHIFQNEHKIRRLTGKVLAELERPANAGESI